MVIQILFLLPFLWVGTATEAAGLFDEFTRNVPRPTQRPQNDIWYSVGEETQNMNALCAQNDHLRKLIDQQNAKIQLLESRIKQLEKIK